VWQSQPLCLEHLEGVADDEVAVCVKLRAQGPAGAQVREWPRLQRHGPALLPRLLDSAVAVKHDEAAIRRHGHRLCGASSSSSSSREHSIVVTLKQALLWSCLPHGDVYVHNVAGIAIKQYISKHVAARHEMLCGCRGGSSAHVCKAQLYLGFLA
jgi:hypothetical protein